MQLPDLLFTRRIIWLPDRSDGSSADVALRRASAKLAVDRVNDAHEACLDALRAEPGHPGALTLCGQILTISGRAAAAVMLLERACTAAPRDAHAWTALGSALLAIEDGVAALGAFDLATSLAPELAVAHVRRGVALLRNGRPEEAVAAVREGALRCADLAGNHLEASSGLLAVGNELEAAASFARAVEIDGRSRRYHAVSAARLDAAGMSGAADLVIAWGLVLQPGDPELSYLADARGGRSHDRAPGAYISRYFDSFAEDFDEILLSNLDYQLPALIGAQLGTLTDVERRGKLYVLDAGCGTGLCVAAIRPYAAQITGVDLSERMLAKARARGGYDRLEAADLVPWMRAHPARFDAVVAADVVIYFGELANLFAAIATALRPGGVVVVSTEPSISAGFELQPSGRFAHDPDYVARSAAGAGFEEIRTTALSYRRDGGRQVPGTIVTGRLADGPSGEGPVRIAE